MNKSNHNTSDTESDEDYTIDCNNGTPESSDDSDASENPEESKYKSSKRRITFKSKTDPIQNVSIPAPRQTRQSAASENIIKSSEKEELQSDEEVDKTRSDTLWADFLSDVGTNIITKTETNSNKATDKATLDVNSDALERSHTSTDKASNGFEKSLVVQKKHTEESVYAPKRQAKGSSVSAVLSQFTKKKKMSVLEKSKVDWKDFKTDEGINEELRTHNKGKDGYLERQDFLQRTDLRQFEIEKKLRQSSRQN
ncbi:craniofacial development protein 1 [Drosophila serrata]|uniref:craniofacial development protein 1 n=1 Tax=Drosophila serrata TaxID=7274 RepID=UPI000A1D1791|nr:craniofacial development protein 1 [Drosophila serrata]KAH8394043.1 hypothetical protein KR200_011305 [Drosophila serrata]